MATRKNDVTEQAIAFELPKINIKYLTVEVIGDSPLIMHKWTVKAKRQMLEVQMKKAKAGKEAKDPEFDFLDSMYWLNEELPEEPTKEEYQKVLKSGKARFGFPAVAFKACAIDAAYQQGAITKKTTARGAFHLMDELVEIKGAPRMREDMVQVGGMSKVADIRYRGEFPEWRATLNIRYNAGAISPEQILNMLNIGGFSNGVGEWRPSRDGSFGTFHVATGKE